MQGAILELFEVTAKEGLQTQEEPMLEGICKLLLQIQAPIPVEIVKAQTKAAGHVQLLVPSKGPKLN